MKILFVAENMNLNGANMSLINLLGAIDPKICQVDLLLYSHTGPLISAIPDYINLIPEDKNLRYFCTDLKTALKQAPLRIKWIRLRAAFLHRFLKKVIAAEKTDIFRWVKGPEPEYDLAAGYCEGSTHAFVLKKTKAKIRIGWLHVRLEDLGVAGKWQKELCEQLDRVVVVSQDSLHSAIACGVTEEKLLVIHNVLPVAKIHRLSGAKADCIRGERTTLLTVGRLVWQKGIDILLDTCVYLKEKQFQFHWYVIGGGQQLEHYRELALQKRIADRVTFLGALRNPYAYMAQCDMYVQPSCSEGWGMAITEAKILGKPVIASDLPVFLEQIQHGENGLISSLNPEEFGKSILQLAQDADLQQKITDNIAREDLGYGEDVNIIYDFCGK